MSKPAERRSWTRGLKWIDLAWVVFSAANLTAMLLLAEWETVPFHFIWVSLTLLYGFRVWGVRPTLWTLGAVILTTATFIYLDVLKGAQPADELTEVPLMSAMFLAMVWHARRRQAAMDQLQRANEAIARVLDRERRFLQDASHELRTPITVALGHAELVHGSTGDPLVREDLRVVVDELTRLRRLADRLLLLAASEHPDFIRPSRIDVEPVVVETLRRWTPVPRVWVLDDVEEATVEADQDRLSLAIDALIENAVKHTTPEQQIRVSVHRRDGMAAISVADGGSGIEPPDLDRIFDRFARADLGRSREGGGFGLGLSIVKTVVEAHGGRVSVHSTPGEGSVFELLLPLVGNGHRPELTAPAQERLARS
ncbi:MAG: HAMP domain-containing histidine kinase [Actinomycetota bacterium]|nr:HAMP domain-containing histidine kinase [Actinomycetota bacterium]